MWSSIFTCALLVFSQVHAAAVDLHELQKRETYVVKENVLVTEQLAVAKQVDGTEVIGQATPVATSLSISDPVLVPEHYDASTPQEPAIPNLSNDYAQPAPQPEMIPENTQSPSNIQPDSNNEQIKSDSPPSKDTPPSNQEYPSLSEVPATTSTNPGDEQIGEEPSKQQDQASNENIPEQPEKKSKATASRNAKRGIAYNDVNKLSVFTSSSKVSWAYNWGSSTPSINNRVEFVPMLWGTGAHADGWTENANKALASGSTHLLAFNEPDLGAQSSLSVGDAVAGYKQLMQPFAGKARLGSPAVTNGGAPMGLSYLQSFIAACTGCTIDFVAIHWYNGGNAADFKNYVTKAHEVSNGRPVWITEFEGPGDTVQQQVFLAEVLPWLDNQDFVERYAYFMASDGNMIQSGVIPSPVGAAFAFS